MKNILIVIIILTSFSFAFAQGTVQKPLTQAEYVQMLYQLERNPNMKQDIIAALRARGIDFKLTSGLRSLTNSKGRNDEELKRTLEESNRRRENPTTSRLPNEAEAKSILEKTRQNTLAAVDDMPDFVVKQLIRRSYAFAGTNRWKSLDRVIIGVSYSPTKGELYEVLAVDGVPVKQTQKAENYAGLDGATTGGEFVEELQKIFKPESKTEFKLIDTDVIRSKPSIVFEYEIALENYKSGVGTKQRSSLTKRMIIDSVPTGQKGKIWVDRENFRILKIEYKLTDIASSSQVKAFNQFIDYDYVKIGEETHLLPILSQAVFTSQYDKQMIETRNVLKFKDYQKYGTEVLILDDDDEEIIEEGKTETPKEKSLEEIDEDEVEPSS